MARTLLVRGLLAGLAAGLIAFLVARLTGENAVAQAIAVEGAHVHAGQMPEPELVSRGVQSTIGLLTATSVFGVALGGIFALVFGAFQGRSALGARALSAVLALAGFVVLYGVPFIKYPPNPPAVGNSDTIGRRTALYFTMIVLSVLVAVLALLAARALRPRLGSWDATIAGAVLFVVLIGLVQWALPAVHEVGRDFPASTLYTFRLASATVQFSVWATLGLLFGALTERSLRMPDPDAAARPQPAGSAV